MLWAWDEFIPGAVLKSFDKTEEWVHSQTNSYNYHVADWRVIKPVFNEEHCIHCQFCWVYCPDAAIISKDKKFSHIDYNHCKGCGICADVCPTNPKSLLMFDEHMPESEALAAWPTKEKKNKVES
ncbi:MAG: 4Fe-4S binding protein [Campylobacterales bacterium]